MAPDYALDFEVYVDASDVGVAAVLVQWRKDPEGNLIPMAILHKSRRFSDREAKWEVACREMYALKYGLFEFREYLQGCPNVSVFSDHLNLVNGLWKHSNPKIVRWRMFLESMRPFTLKHIRGTDQMQMAADALSRLHIRNLFALKDEEETDPAVIRMMERGEGEDDENMFNDLHFAKSAETQTDFLNALYGSSNLSRASRVPTLQEQALVNTYGVGFNLLERMGWSTTAHVNPISLPRNVDRAGVGFKRSRHRCDQPSSNVVSSAPAAAKVSNYVTSCVHVADWANDVADWANDEGERKASSDRSHDALSANPTTRRQSQQNAQTPSDPLPAATSAGNPPSGSSQLNPAPPASSTTDTTKTDSGISKKSGVSKKPLPVTDSSQTTPQDFRDAAYTAAGGFPLADLLRRAHDETHPGFLTTWRRVIRALGPQPNLESSKIKSEVRRWCDACLCCQKLQPARSKLLANIGSIRQRPFSSYAFDVVTLSVPDLNGVRYILCCVDSFSRAVELYGLKQANASSVVECLNDVLCRWGRGHELRCDNAKAFTSAVVKALLKKAKVKMHLTAPYSHQSNGQVENCNRRVMDILRAMIIDDRLGPNTQQKWSMLLPEVRRVLMTRTVTQHGLTPNDLAYMNCPETETSIFEEELWMQLSSDVPQLDDPEWLVKLHQQHEALVDICDEKQDELLQKLAELNSRNREESTLRSIQVHDFVLLKLTDRPQKKDQPRWAGPYLVIAFPDNDPTRPMATLQHLSSKVVGDFHLNMLKFCDMSLMKQVEDAIPYAAKDNFEYEIEAVMSHQPSGPRRTSTGLRNKSEYEFKCLWKDLPLGEDNPSWEPWSNDSMRQCEAYIEYTKQQHIIDQLGEKF